MSSSPLNFAKLNHKQNLFSNVKQVLSKQNLLDSQKLHRRLNTTTSEVMFYKQIIKQQKDHLQGYQVPNADNQQKNSSKQTFMSHYDSLVQQVRNSHQDSSNYYLKNYESQRQKKKEYLQNKTQQSGSRSPSDTFLTPKKNQNSNNQSFTPQKQKNNQYIYQLQQQNKILLNDLETFKQDNYNLKLENMQQQLQIQVLEDGKNESQQEEMKKIIVQQTDFIRQLIENKQQVTEKYKNLFQETVDFKQGVDEKFNQYSSFFEEIYKKKQDTENISQKQNESYLQTAEEETQKNKNHSFNLNNENKKFQLDSSIVRSSQTIENTPRIESPKDQDYDFDLSFQKFLEEKKQIKEKLDQIISNFQKSEQMEFVKNTITPLPEIQEDENQFSFCNSEA